MGANALVGRRPDSPRRATEGHGAEEEEEGGVAEAMGASPMTEVMDVC